MWGSIYTNVEFTVWFLFSFAVILLIIALGIIFGSRLNSNNSEEVIPDYDT